MIAGFRRKKFSTAFSLLTTITTVVIWSILGPAACKAQGSPKIEVDAQVFDFGVIYRGGSAEHDFIIRNGGNDTLRIKEVRSSCGCTAAILDQKTLGPNGQTKLKARFDSGRFKGKVIKKIFVYTNDPKTPTTILEITGEIKVDLEVSPSMVYFSGLKAGDRITRKISLKNLSDSLITIQEISSTVPAIKLELSKMKIEPGEASNLNLTVDEVEKDMKLTGSLTIRNTSRQDTVTVRLYGGRIE